MKLSLILSFTMLLACSMHAQTVKELQTAIAALQKQVAALQTTDTAQSATIAALQRQVTLIASNPLRTSKRVGLGRGIPINTPGEYGCLALFSVTNGTSKSIPSLGVLEGWSRRSCRSISPNGSFDLGFKLVRLKSRNVT